MLGKLLPLIFLLAGTGIGVGSAVFLPGQPRAEAPPSGDPIVDTNGHVPVDGQHEYVKLHDPFVVPIVENDRVTALVVVSLSLETGSGMEEKIARLEPKLRDTFLQVLFDHANMGGFSGAFTEAEPLIILRNALRDGARRELGDGVSNVLIVDIARQDV